METRDFERLKLNIEETKNKLNRAEGVKEQLYLTLKTQYGFDTIEQANASIEKKSKDIMLDKKKKEEMIKELDSIVDWDKL